MVLRLAFDFSALDFVYYAWNILYSAVRITVNRGDIYLEKRTSQWNTISFWLKPGLLLPPPITLYAWIVFRVWWRPVLYFIAIMCSLTLHSYNLTFWILHKQHDSDPYHLSIRLDDIYKINRQSQLAGFLCQCYALTLFTIS